MAGELALTVMIQGQNLLTGMIRDIGSQFGILGAGLATVGVAAVGVGIESTKMAGDFQTSLLSLVAHAGLAKSQFDTVSQSVLAMSTAVGRSPTQLAEALYPILSAFSGIQNQSAKSAIALDTLKMSFETVAGTTVDGTAVANAAVGTFNALGLATNNVSTNTARMTGLFDVMDKTVQLGNMQWDAYKNVVSKLAVAIQGTGITFNESQAALATMTNEGFSAQRASTYLSNTFTTLAIKTDALAKHAKSLGISFDESKYGPMSLADKIQYLNQITDGNKQKLLALMGNNSTALKTFNALSVGVGAYKSNLDALNHAQGTLAGSFATASQGFNFQMQQLKAAGDALMITIGAKLLPVAGKVVAAITPIVSAFTQWSSSGKAISPMLQNITGMFGVMDANWQQFGATIQHILGGPLQQFGQMMGSLLPGFISQFLRATNDVQLVLQDVGTAVASIAAPAIKVLGQAFKGAQGFIETALGAIEGQFLPALHNLISAIAPIVAGIVKWLASSNALGIAFNVLSVVVKVVVGVISFLVNVLAAIITFFSQTALGVAIFRAILVILGVAMTIIAVIVLSVVIPAFIAWVAGAVAVGIANIIAFAPIILIVLAIVAVVTIVILIITHWGAIANWLKGVWGGISSFFGNLFSGIGTAMHNLVTGIGTMFSGLGSTVHSKLTDIKNGVGGFFSNLGSTAHNAWQGLQQGAQNGAQGVANAMKWMYDHNYYVKNLVDFVKTQFTEGVKFWQGVWSNFTTWLGNLWNGIKDTASNIWNAISNFFQTTWNNDIAFIKNVWRLITLDVQLAWMRISSWLQGVWNKISGFFETTWNNDIAFLQKIWNLITSSVQLAWSKISQVFGAAWSTYISGPLGNLWNSISGWFTNLTGQMLQFGKNLIQGLINGIKSMMGAVGNAASNVASTIAQFLGFHSPAAQGEGRYIVEWGQGMVKGFVAGMQQAQPLLNAQVSHMISAPRNLAYGGASAGNAFALGGGSQTIVVQMQPGTINLDGKRVGESVSQYQAAQVRRQGGWRNS